MGRDEVMRLMADALENMLGVFNNPAMWLKVRNDWTIAATDSAQKALVAYKELKRSLENAAREGRASVKKSKKTKPEVRPRTEKEIRAEIATLKEMKPRIPDTMFESGGSNHGQVDAQVEALENFYDEDRCYERWPGIGQIELAHAAADAVRWRDGVAMDDDEAESPSDSWKVLAK